MCLRLPDVLLLYVNYGSDVMSSYQSLFYGWNCTNGKARTSTNQRKWGFYLFTRCCPNLNHDKILLLLTFFQISSLTQPFSAMGFIGRMYEWSIKEWRMCKKFFFFPFVVFGDNPPSLPPNSEGLCALVFSLAGLSCFSTVAFLGSIVRCP